MLNADGTPASGAEIRFEVLNYAEFGEIACARTDAKGKKDAGDWIWHFAGDCIQGWSLCGTTRRCGKAAQLYTETGADRLSARMYGRR